MKLSTEEVKCIGLFQDVTRAYAVDCLVNEKVVFVVSPGQMGLAIGKSGENIRKVSRMLKKPVEVVEYAEDFNKFVANLSFPAVPKSIEREGDKLVIHTDSRGRYLLKRENGKILKRMKSLLERHYGKISKIEVKS